MNNYYIAQNKVSGACNFGGQASLQSAQAASGTCASLLNEAGTAGTGQVTSTNGGSGSGSKSAASGTFGDFRILAAVVAAFLGGITLVVV
jgi:1,3-beta-glucanosyltransferase GAS1